MTKIKLGAYNQPLNTEAYASIDQILEKWVSRHQLKLLKMHQDYEIRSVEVGPMTKGSRSFEINIGVPDDSGNTKIIIRNVNPPYNSETLSCSRHDLDEVLERALKIAQGVE